VRVSLVADTEALTEAFVRPAGFDLALFWEKWCAEYETNRPSYPVRARVSPALLPFLRHFFGESADILSKASSPDVEGWVTLTLPFEDIHSARGRILGFGRAVEVLEPEALRKSVIDFAEQIVGFYQDQVKVLADG
jgi:hypothetical protein